MDEKFVGHFEPGRVLDAYRLLRLLGTGGMGEVYEAEHVQLKVRRALKVFAVEGESAALFRTRFLSEGKLLAELNHPRVVRLHEFGVDSGSGRPYFVMDLVLSLDGTPKTLEDLRREGVDESTAFRLFRDVCEGLDYVHSRGIVHRDVKLENILIDADGRAVLSDFGISRIFDETLRRKLDIAFTLVQDERVIHCLGSHFYRAPEMEGENPVPATTATDAWALGVLMFRFLTGFWFERTSREKGLAILETYDLSWNSVVDHLCDEDPFLRIPEGGLLSIVRTLADNEKDAVCEDGAVLRHILLIVALVVVGCLLAGSAIVCLLPRQLWPRRDARRACDPAEIAVTNAVRTVRQTGAADGTAKVICDGCESGGIKISLSEIPLPALCPEAPSWRAYYASNFAALDDELLKGACPTGGIVRLFLERHVDASQSADRDRRRLAEWQIEEADKFIDDQMRLALNDPKRLNPAQLFVLAGEVLLQKKKCASEGDFPADGERLGELAVRFLAANDRFRVSPEWVFEKLNVTGVCYNRAVYLRVANDVNAQSLTDGGVLKLWHGSVLADEARRVRRGRRYCEMSEEDMREYEEKHRGAARLYAEAALLKNPLYAASRRLLESSLGDPAASRRWFEACLRQCFDDLRVWDMYAYSLTTRWGGSTAALEQLLEVARVTASNETWVPAYYVLGRWDVLAGYERTSRVQRPDDRIWAYESPDVRTNSLAIIRQYVDNGRLSAEPSMFRNQTTAVFAVVALVCGDEGLASWLVKSLPEDKLILSLLRAAETRSDLHKRLVALYRKPEKADPATTGNEK